MKHKKLIYCIISALTIFTGCSREIFEPPVDLYRGDGRTVDISLSAMANGMNVLSNTKALDDLGEKNIQDLYVAFFPVSGSSDAPVVGNKIYGNYFSYDELHKAIAEPGHDNAGYVSVKNIPTGSYYIVGIANIEFGAHQGFLEKLEAVKTWEDIHNVAVTLRDDPAFPINVDRNTPALCMSGYYREPGTQDNVQNPPINKPFPVAVTRSGQLPGYIHLRRLDAHVTFIVRNEIPNCNSFTMQNARMFNVPKSSKLFEDDEDESVSYITTEQKTNAWVFKPKVIGSEDPTTKYDTYTWSMYLMENRKEYDTPSGYDELSTYKQRELEYKEENGSNFHKSNGDREYNYVYAPEESAFLEFNASMEQTMAEGDDSFSRVATMKYVVHLGYCEGDTEAERSKDFHNRRNTKYTYIIHIRGVNDIVVEAISQELYEPSFSHGVEGNVVDLRSGQVNQMDTHFGVFNMSMTRHQISALLVQIRSRAGEWSSVKYRSQGGVIRPEDMPRYIESPESFDPFPNYLSEDYQAIRISPLPAGWDPTKKLVSYSQTYDYDWPQGQASWKKPSIMLPLHGEKKVQQDATHTYPLFDLLGFKEAFSTPRTAENPWGYEVDEHGVSLDMDTPIHFTVFVNEYYYYYPDGLIPKTRTLGSDGSVQDDDCVSYNAWHFVANTGHRFYRFLSDGYDSVDSDSHYLTGSIYVEQRAPQTYYSDKVNLAVALEHTNEHHWKLVTNSNNQNNAGHGWLAAANVLAGNNWGALSDQNTVLGEGYPAFSTKSYTSATGTTSAYGYRPLGNNNDLTKNDKWTDRFYFPTSGSNIDRKYYDVIEAALSRNRDLNRDGVITEDEIRWYLPFVEEYVNFAVGQGALETPLFSRKDYSPEIVGNEQVYANRRFHYIAANHQYLWSEEGTSTGGGVLGWELRCCRLMGAADDNYRQHTSLSLPYEYNPNSRVFDTAKFAEKGIHRGYTKGALQPHDNLELEANALPYYFKMAKEDAPLRDKVVVNNGMTRQQILWNRMVSNEYCRNYTEDPEATFNQDGTIATARDKGAWHTPNQMELALMYYGPKIRPSGGQFLSSTYWWRNDGKTIPEGMVSDNTTDYRHYMGANANNLRMMHTGHDLYTSVLIVRCVLDCDKDGNPIGSPEFGNPIEFIPDEDLVACTYDGDFANLSIGASMSAGVLKSVTVNGVNASFSDGLTSLSQVRIPVNKSVVTVVWKVEHGGRILTYSCEYRLPARYWMISRYGVDNRYATVDLNNNRTTIAPNYSGDLDEAPALYKWVVSKSPTNPVNETVLETGVTYYFMNAGSRNYINGPKSGSQSYITMGENPVAIKLQNRSGYDGYYIIRLNNSTNANSNGGVGNFGTWTGVDDGSTYKLTPVVMKGEMPMMFEFDQDIIVNPDGYSVHITTNEDAIPTSVTIDGKTATVTGGNGDYTATIVTSSPSGAVINTTWVISYQGGTATRSTTYTLPAKYWVIESGKDNTHYIASVLNGQTRLTADGGGNIESLSANYKWIVTRSTDVIENVSNPVPGEYYYLYNIGEDYFVTELASWGKNASLPVMDSTPMKFQFQDSNYDGCFSMKAFNGNTFRGWINRIDGGFGFWNTTTDQRTESGNRWRFRPLVQETPVLNFRFVGGLGKVGDNYVSTASCNPDASISVMIGGVPANVQRNGNTVTASVPVASVPGSVVKALWGITIGNRSYERSQSSISSYWAFRDRDNNNKAVTVQNGLSVLRTESLNDTLLPDDCKWLLLLPGDETMTNQTPSIPTNSQYLSQRYILYNIETGLYLGTSSNGTNVANNFTMVSDPSQALQIEVAANSNGKLFRVTIGGRTGYFDRRTDWNIGVNSGLRHAWYFNLVRN